MNATQLVEEFQCSGCALGSDTKCGKFNLSKSYGLKCTSHCSGTTTIPGGPIYLGLPKGFNKVGMGFDETNPFASEEIKHNNIRLWAKGTHPKFDEFNVAVWAMEKNGFLFVRTYSPRINLSYIDVIEGGRMNHHCPNAIDVALFVNEID